MHFLYPNVIFFMLIPTIILAFLILSKKSSIEKHFSKEALERLKIKNNHLSIRQRTFILYICILLMTISLARPVLDKKEQEFKQETISFVIALDVSKSMFADDLKPNRLKFAKQKLIQIIKNSKQNAIGVVLFSNSSYILSPLTQDFISLKILVENLNLNQKFDEGSSLLSALKTANKLLRYNNSKNILLLTDGTNNTNFEEEIEFAQKNSLNIYTIGTATKKQTPIKLHDNSYLTNKYGQIVTVALNEKIQKLSLKSNGAYIQSSLNNSDLRAILQQIESNSKKESLKNRRFKTYVELFYFPLALSLILMLIAFSSIPKLKRATPILILLLFNFDAKASLFDFQTIQKANKAYEEKKFNQANQEFKKVSQTVEGRYNYANALYKSKRYKQALEEYKKVVTSDEELQFKKLHNLGNTYTKLNDLQNAVKMYEKALKLKEDEKTKKNLEIVKDAIKKQQKKQQQKDDQNKNPKKQKQNKTNQADNKAKKKKNEKSEKKDLEKSKTNDKKNSIENISDMEEKKWLKNLNNQQMKILLKKDITGDKNNDNCYF